MIMLSRKPPLEGREQSQILLQKKLPSEKPEWKKKLLPKSQLDKKPFVGLKFNPLLTLKEQKKMLLKKALHEILAASIGQPWAATDTES